MRSRNELPYVRKIQILRNQEAPFFLSELPYLMIGFTCKPLLLGSMNIMPKRFQTDGQGKWKVFIELDFHRICGTAGTGRSSSAEAAAKAMAA